MSEIIRSEYKEQLPKLKRLTVGKIFSFLAAISSILSLIFFILSNYFEDISLYIIYPVSMVLINILLIIYVLIQEKNKNNRYTDTTLYTHYVNHIIRDYLFELQLGYERPLSDLLKDILNNTANCFSLITGSKCRSSLKELKNDLTIDTICRDSYSGSNINIKKKFSKIKLSENTDFYNLWYSLEGCSRYFISNDLIKLFKLGKYKNSSFSLYGSIPKEKKFLGLFLKINNWSLPYKSTIVLPIRYVGAFKPPEKKQKTKIDNDSDWNIWGFLCIDANKKNAFDTVYAPELGATFADILFLLFNDLGKFDIKS